MEKASDFIFKYPPNLRELDLATMVTMYRQRGEVKKAPPGQYIACSETKKVLREAKEWFGLYYSQEAWDALLTKGSGGYPMTEAEMNALGLIYSNRNEPPHREYVEKNTGTIPKLAYLLLNDMKQFGFLKEDKNGFLTLTSSGEQALQGVAKRMYGKPFTEEMLAVYRPGDTGRPEKPRSGRTPDQDTGQTSLF